MVYGKASNKYYNLHIINYLHGLRHYVASYPPAIYFYKDIAATQHSFQQGVAIREMTDLDECIV